MANTENEMQSLWSTSQLGVDGDYLELLYEQYLRDPGSLSQDWQQYFSSLPGDAGTEVIHSDVREQFKQMAAAGPSRSHTNCDVGHERKQVGVSDMITGFRARGHLNANLDPLHLKPQKQVENLLLETYGLSQADMSETFSVETFTGLPKQATLAEIHAALNRTYCDSLGVEFMQITDNKERVWLQDRIESVQGHPKYSAEVKKTLLEKLTAAEGLERYLHTKYVGQKRFSLEGGESLIPMLHEILQRGGEQGVQETVIGMAHRGRLNVLVNILGKLPSELFDEFEGRYNFDEMSSGDVKYHQGFSTDISTSSGTMHLALAFNPSHLEIVAPVVEGSVKARQARINDTEMTKILPINIHGDSAFAGQGVVMETLQMSQARNYKTGGTIHIVINNQVGFTTSNPEDTRSTVYCTDVARMIQCPVFHVNGDDPEAVLLATQIALDYRMTFHKDVVIDLVCYRRHGHNEADEPSATQPLMYQVVRKHETTRALYAKQLVSENVISADDEKETIARYRSLLESGQPAVSELVEGVTEKRAADWRPYLGNDWDVPGDSSYQISQLEALGQKIFNMPQDFVLQTQVKKVMADRVKMVSGEQELDWGCAENLAYASLLEQGFSIRISGQDCGRGTFSHRHAQLHCQKSGEAYIPLQHLDKEQPNFTVIDSLLSEEAVLAFEYGYATTEPSCLTIWEAQFGDFANGAQVVIDQFISSGEHKWGRLCGLVMLLPHGYEGMGPEHSSARLERYLQLCAEHNIQVCVPSTPSQVFHMLRRQMVRPFRRPLIVMSPKSLLRHRLATSPMNALADGKFHNVIPEIDDMDPKQVRRVIMCSGKVYYDLLQERRTRDLKDIAIIRIEQLYPFPKEDFKEIMAPYAHVQDIVWCQEEPKNQGAWYCTLHHLEGALPDTKVRYVGRAASASPAAGYPALHKKQQTEFVDEALS